MRAADVLAVLYPKSGDLPRRRTDSEERHVRGASITRAPRVAGVVGQNVMNPPGAERGGRPSERPVATIVPRALGPRPGERDVIFGDYHPRGVAGRPRLQLELQRR